MGGKARLVLAVGLGLALALAAGLSAAAAGQTAAGGIELLAAASVAPCDRYVLITDGGDTTDCSDEDHPCRTVQHALKQAVTGDTICVAHNPLAGVAEYTGTLNITKTVTLDGAWEASCVDPSDLTCAFTAVPCNPGEIELDAQGAGRVISISGHISPVIRCFTITGGDADELFGDPDGMNAGGGIYSRDAAPIIVGNTIAGNYGCDVCSSTYGRGGGIYLLNAPSTAVISGNLIAKNVADNTTWGQGGGIELRDSDALVIYNHIEGNRAGLSAGDGGGIMVVGGSPTIADNRIADNVAGQSVICAGGGIFVRSGEAVTIERNSIEGNRAVNGATAYVGVSSCGGGIFFGGASELDPAAVAIIRDNMLANNVAALLGPHTGEGGGMCLTGLVSPSLVSGNELEWNYGGFNDNGWGGGIYVLSSTVVITGNQFRYNNATWAGHVGAGGGLYMRGSAALVNGNSFTGNHGAGFPGAPSTANGDGGAIALVGSESTIEDNWLAENGGTNGEGTGRGGGIFAEGGTLRLIGNTIVTGTASSLGYGYGGGVVISDSVVLLDGNWIGGNLAAGDSPGYGGGIYALYSSVTAVHNTVANNTAAIGSGGFGGGVYLWYSEPWLDSNSIVDNRARPGDSGNAGGVRVYECDAFTLTNNIVARNAAYSIGSGIAVYYSSGTLAHNTIAENFGGDGSGVRFDAQRHSMVLDNNIIVSQTVGIYNSAPGLNVLVARYTLFEGNGLNYGAGVSSSHEVAGPAELRGDYHLEGDSGAINQAPLLAWVNWDFDGDPRPSGPLADVGADEVMWLWLPLVLRQGP